MTSHKKNKQLAKLLAYVLERHPEEFGLIPDEAGYVKIKELLKALSETDGWRHIRENSINELLLVDGNPPVEISGRCIRAKQRAHLPETVFSPEVPRILYTCIRQKAYPRVLEKGISSSADTPVVCTPDTEMAIRLGKRKDRNAVRLTIHTAKTAEKGVVFYRFTDMFFLADHIPPDTFTGPPPPKKPEKEKRPGRTKTASPGNEAGAFPVTPDMLGPPKPARGKKNTPDWKKDRKHRRRNDRKSWPDDS